MSDKYPVESIVIDYRPEALDYIQVSITITDTQTENRSCTYNRRIQPDEIKGHEWLREIAEAGLALIRLDK